jgi:hypothetical protein
VVLYRFCKEAIVKFTFLTVALAAPGAFAVTRNEPFEGNCAERNVDKARHRKRKLKKDNEEEITSLNKRMFVIPIPTQLHIHNLLHIQTLH